MTKTSPFLRLSLLKLVDVTNSLFSGYDNFTLMQIRHIIIIIYVMLIMTCDTFKTCKLR